jgi:hypothetical protein
MKIKLKLALLCVPFLFVISCSDSNEVQESKVTWDATNYTMYNEFMQCTAGEDYSQEALDEMIDSWRGLGLSKSLLGGWGYVSVSPNKSSFNNYWELSWSSKEEADAAWEEWVANKDAMAWSEQSASILQCDGENRDGYEFTFPYDPYAFGESPADGSFAAAFSPCTLNEGMGQDDLNQAIISYNAWLDGIDQSQVSGFYAYGIYIPEDKNMEEDFWFGNFHENLETMNAGNELWEATGGEAKAALESVSTCGVPEISNGQVFFDPAKPDFS